MFLTSHAVTGTFLALNIEEPVILVPAAIGSHFVLDALPHFGTKSIKQNKYRLYTVAAIDLSCTIIFYFFVIHIWPQKMILITIGILGAILPDLFYFPRYVLNINEPRWLRKFHKNIQWFERPLGLVTEIFWITLLLLMMKKL